jgi:hypothetical protein
MAKVHGLLGRRVGCAAMQFREFLNFYREIANIEVVSPSFAAVGGFLNAGAGLSWW